MVQAGLRTRRTRPPVRVAPLTTSSGGRVMVEKVEKVEKDYGPRSVVDKVDKLGITPGTVAAFVHSAWRIDNSLLEQVLARTGRPPAELGEQPEVVVVAIDQLADAAAELEWLKRE